MKKILAMLHPFDLQQKVFVYENGNKIDAATPTIEELNAILTELAEKHAITQIDFRGSKQYVKGLIEKFDKYQATKYNAQDIKIECRMI